jgi:hypothetical protein
MSVFQTEPPALDFVIPGFLSGTVGALYSPGGVGKSFQYFLRHEGGVLLPAPQERDEDTGNSSKEKRMAQLRNHGPKVLPSLLNPFGSSYLAAKNGDPYDW